jgi:hypothetical protein
MNKQEVTLYKRNKWDWSQVNSRSQTLCAEQFETAIHLPKRVRRVVLVFTDKRTAQSFKLRSNTNADSLLNPYQVNKNSNLTLAADRLIRENLDAGRPYVRVEYE